MNNIFPTWKSYTDALSECMSTEFYSESFPEYAKLLDENGEIVNVNIVNDLLVLGYDAQEGFDLFIKACFAGTRYIREFEYLQTIVDLFVVRGAVVTQHMVDESFITFYNSATNFEDECNNIAGRTVVLDMIGKYITTPIPDQDSWKNIKATYWEVIPSDTEYSMKCMMYRKLCSKFLQSI